MGQLVLIPNLCTTNLLKNESNLSSPFSWSQRSVSFARISSRLPSLTSEYMSSSRYRIWKDLKAPNMAVVTLCCMSLLSSVCSKLFYLHCNYRPSPGHSEDYLCVRVERIIGDIFQLNILWVVGCSCWLINYKQTNKQKMVTENKNRCV